MNKYKILNVIGDGTYGTVYKGINIETNEYVAIKQLKDKITSWNECITQNEVRILRNLSHDNIVKLHEIIRDQNSSVSLIFEYCDKNLYEFIKEYQRRNEIIPESKIRSIIYQIINGLKYLHLKGYFHRDLKPENILIKDESVKIADFGTCKEIPNYKDNILTDYVCTRWYRAPECILKSKNYNQSIDIWAVGCILCELYLLKPIFPGESEFDQINKIIQILGTPNFNEWPEGYKLSQKLGITFPREPKKNLNRIIRNANNDAIKLIEDIFQFDEGARPNAGRLLNYSYFQEMRPSSSLNYPSRYSLNLNDYDSNLNNIGNLYNNNNNNNNDYNISTNNNYYDENKKNSNYYNNTYYNDNNYSNNYFNRNQNRNNNGSYGSSNNLYYLNGFRNNNTNNILNNNSKRNLQNIAANNILFNRGFNNNSNTNSNNYYKDFKVPSFYNRANSLINYDSSNIYGALNNKPLKIYGTNYDYGFV